MLTPKNKVQSVSDFLLENTSTIGVRSYAANRKILPRSLKTIETSLGKIEVKEVELPSGAKRTTIEYESAKKIAVKLDRPVAEIFSILNKEL